MMVTLETTGFQNGCRGGRGNAYPESDDLAGQKI